MIPRTLARALIGIALALPLAGCVDIALDVDLTGPATARAMLTQVMNADFYAMRGRSDIPPEDNVADAFCAEGRLVENVDGSATCTLFEAGRFAALDLGQDEGGVSFTPQGNGVVRIALSTAMVERQMGVDGQMPIEARQFTRALFAGHTLTLTFAGAEVLDTNMTLSEDETSATLTIALSDLASGEADLPETLFALVRAP